MLGTLNDELIVIMNIEITAFGIAKDILNQKKLSFQLNGNTVGELRSQLMVDFPAFEQLRSLKFAVNTDYVEDSFELTEKDEVVLIPPVSGG
jgi:molybdopterin converting factor small subunit